MKERMHGDEWTREHCPKMEVLLKLHLIKSVAAGVFSRTESVRCSTPAPDRQDACGEEMSFFFLARS